MLHMERLLGERERISHNHISFNGTGAAAICCLYTFFVVAVVIFVLFLVVVVVPELRYFLHDSTEFLRIIFFFTLALHFKQALDGIAAQNLSSYLLMGTSAFLFLLFFLFVGTRV